MRLVGLFLVGIVGLACKDKEPAAPAGAARGSQPSRASTPEGATRAPERPSLDPAGGSATDAAWAESTAAAIRAVAPELTDIACRESECSGTLVAASETELVELADKLQTPESLRSTEAKHILLTAPERVGGKLAMKIVVRYER